MLNIKIWSWLGFFASSQLYLLTGLPRCCWLGNNLQNEGDLEKRNYNCSENILKFSKMCFVAAQAYITCLEHPLWARYQEYVVTAYIIWWALFFYSSEHIFKNLSLSCTNLTWLATFCCTNKKWKCPSRLVKLPDIIFKNYAKIEILIY